jgi:hypothetical protein
LLVKKALGSFAHRLLLASTHSARTNNACIRSAASACAPCVPSNLKIAMGRSDAAKKATGDALFEVIKQHFAAEFEKHGLALSLEINEFSETGTWKHNNLHARLKANTRA